MKLTLFLKGSIYSLLIAVLVTACASSANAQSTGSTNVGGGVLSWTVTESNHACNSYGTYQEWQFTNFKFYISKSISLTGSVVYFDPTEPQGPAGCPPNGAEPSPLPLTASGLGCTIDFYAENGGGGTATASGTCNHSAKLETYSPYEFASLKTPSYNLTSNSSLAFVNRPASVNLAVEAKAWIKAWRRKEFVRSALRQS